MDEDVYVAGSGFAAGTNVDVYVVPDQDWNDGDVGPVLVWNAPLAPRYLRYRDRFRTENRVYDAATDGLDSGSPGFVVIAGATPISVPVITPPGIIALIDLLCVAGVSRIRRRFI